MCIVIELAVSGNSGIFVGPQQHRQRGTKSDIIYSKVKKSWQDYSFNQNKMEYIIHKNTRDHSDSNFSIQ